MSIKPVIRPINAPGFEAPDSMPVTPCRTILVGPAPQVCTRCFKTEFETAKKMTECMNCHLATYCSNRCHYAHLLRCTKVELDPLMDAEMIKIFKTTRAVIGHLSAAGPLRQKFKTAPTQENTAAYAEHVFSTLSDLKVLSGYIDRLAEKSVDASKGQGVLPKQHVAPVKESKA